MRIMKDKTDTTMTTEPEKNLESSPHRMSAFEEMDRLFDNYMSRGWLSPFRFHKPLFNDKADAFEGKAPCVDVIDNEKEIVIKAELPGVEKKDLDITVTKNSVSIKGTTRHEEKEEKADYYHCEISRGSYQRTITLPTEVHEDKAKAKFKDGVLMLTLPKMEKAKQRKVEVD